MLCYGRGAHSQRSRENATDSYCASHQVRASHFRHAAAGHGSAIGTGAHSGYLSRGVSEESQGIGTHGACQMPGPSHRHRRRRVRIYRHGVIRAGNRCIFGICRQASAVRFPLRFLGGEHRPFKGSQGAVKGRSYQYLCIERIEWSHWAQWTPLNTSFEGSQDRGCQS